MKNYLIYLILIGLTVLVFVYLNFDKQKEYKLSLFYMDTFITVKIYEENESVFNEIEDLYERYHNLTNRYESVDGVNNIYYLNNVLENNKEIILDEDLYNLLEYSKLIYNETNGNINIAIGNAVDVWKPYRDYEKVGIPTNLEFEKMSSTSIEDIILSNGKFTKQNDVKIDLGALVKGYVTEKASEILKENDIEEYIINAGGNVKVGKSLNNGYKIGIADPLKAGEIFQKLNIENKSIVTSGGYERYYEYQGVKYHHILDSKTFFPPENNLASVTVITENSTYADMMSTYLFVLGYEEGKKLIEETNIEVIWYFTDGEIIKTIGVNKYE